MAAGGGRGSGLTCVGIQRTSSIEFEPRTLDFGQIQFAREAALYVMNTKSVEEAFQIFTQGLEPVASVSRKGDEDDAGVKIQLIMDDEDDEYCQDSTLANRRLFETTPHRRRFKDASTAPF